MTDVDDLSFEALTFGDEKASVDHEDNYENEASKEV